jgi:hypothetical protein
MVPFVIVGFEDELEIPELPFPPETVMVTFDIRGDEETLVIPVVLAS